MTIAARDKMRAAWANRRALGVRSPKLGVPRTAAERAAISAAVLATTKRGAEHYNWKGGITHGQKRKRKGRRYLAWRKAVEENAGGACECCQLHRPGRMCAHHLKPFSTHPDLALDVENGAWLCFGCHADTHEACGLMPIARL